MKRFFLLLVGAMMICTVRAQVVAENEAALVYYSPKTVVSLDFTYTVETAIRGQYAEFAEDLLGVTDVVKENSTEYTLKGVRISTRTETDYSRPHKVSADAGVPLLLTINEKGLLVGYNAPLPPKPERAGSHESSSRPAAKSRISPKSTAPYTEEVLTAANPLAQANEVAKQIFHIRETRMYLLNGEVEHAPADGKSMELVLAELDKQEEALTELFIGKKHKKTDHKIVQMAPKDGKQYLYFSEENGFTDAENIDADTVNVEIALHRQTLKSAEGKKKGKGAELSVISYNLPGDADVRVVFNGRTLATKNIPVAQAGVDVPLPQNLFIGAELPKIVFSEKTGNVISISK